MNWIFPILVLVVALALVFIATRVEKYSANKLDAVIYINLENRHDRKPLILKEIEKLGIDKSKIHKVSGVYTPKNGHKGCVQSHILALQMAKLNKWQRVLILEDDAEMTVEPNVAREVISKCMDIPDWNVFMLGTCFKKIEGVVKDIGSGFEVEKVTLSTTGTAYVVKHNYIDTLMNVYHMSNDNMSRDGLSQKDYEPWAFDQQWVKLQEKDIWYCLNRDLFRQRNIWSTTQSTNLQV